jgi:hypothetical protein
MGGAEKHYFPARPRLPEHLRFGRSRPFRSGDRRIVHRRAPNGLPRRSRCRRRHEHAAELRRQWHSTRTTLIGAPPAARPRQLTGRGRGSAWLLAMARQALGSRGVSVSQERYQREASLRRPRSRHRCPHRPTGSCRPATPPPRRRSATVPGQTREHQPGRQAWTGRSQTLAWVPTWNQLRECRRDRRHEPVPRSP